MAEQGQETVFRKETMERISAPEQLTEYLRITNPGIWAVLTAVILLLAGIIAWASVGTLETAVDAAVHVEDHTAQVVTVGGRPLAAGMTLRVAGQEFVIASAEADEYGRAVGIAAVGLPDGGYDGKVVVESVHPIDFLMTSK